MHWSGSHKGISVYAVAGGLCTCWLLSAAGAERAEILAKAAESITAEETQTLVDKLADDSFEGREAGSRGGRAAGNLLMKQFEEFGLSPAGDDGTFFQSFRGSSRNILGLWEGSDPELKQQVIVVGAHYDHVGYGRATNSFGPIGYIHNGADDNASGTAAILEVIDALTQLPEGPKRSILFVLWDAEEQGLLGSQHWLSAPTVSRERIVASINLDMVGRLRDERLQIYGHRTGKEFRRVLSEANRTEGLTIDFDWKMKADSDHWPFISRSIPTVMFHTGLHGDYHRPSDDPHTVNHEGVARVARVAFYSLVALADRPESVPFREAGRREHAGNKTVLEQPVAPQAPRYGLPYRVVEGDPPQFVLTGVTAGSAAERAGFRAGDRLVAFQGQPLTEETSFRLALLGAEGETSFTVERPDETLPVELKLTPAGPPIRVGLTWRSDDAEPGTVIITQVIYGSPAYLAGVKTADRVYRVNERSFESSDEFARLITTEPSPLVLEIERDGKLRAASLAVLPAVEAVPAP
jgi:membrane-associated protease RseP (regulator of RpoE activity)